MLNETIWLPCLVISVCLSAAFVAILMEHRRNGRVFVDQFCTWFLAPFRDPNYQSNAPPVHRFRARLQNAPRKQQELLISRLCESITIFGAMLITNFAHCGASIFSRTLDTFMIIPAAFLLGSTVLAPKVVAKLDPYLNRLK